MCFNRNSSFKNLFFFVFCNIIRWLRTNLGLSLDNLNISLSLSIVILLSNLFSSKCFFRLLLLLLSLFVWLKRLLLFLFLSFSTSLTLFLSLPISLSLSLSHTHTHMHTHTHTHARNTLVFYLSHFLSLSLSFSISLKHILPLPYILLFRFLRFCCCCQGLVFPVNLSSILLLISFHFFRFFCPKFWRSSFYLIPIPICQTFFSTETFGLVLLLSCETKYHWIHL